MKLSTLLLRAACCGLLLLLATFTTGAQIIFVTPSGGGNQSGSSWGNAAPGTQLQAKINGAASGNQVWVAAGTYLPNTYPAGCTNCDPNVRNYAFQLKNNVGIYGGFAGTEAGLSQRNITANPTVLSGDIGNVGSPLDNCFHVVVTIGNDNTAKLDGFTVTGGSDASGGNVTTTILGYTIDIHSGAGLCAKQSSPTISNCTFSNNSSYSGGGVYNDNSSPTITDCSFIFNAGSAKGGGIANDNSSPVITGCYFSGNRAFAGGGIGNSNSSPAITNCTFSQNSGSDKGGGIVNYNACNVSIVNSLFAGNSALIGGALYGYDANSSFTIINCTFSGNRASTGDGSVLLNSSPSTTLANCIIWGNGNPAFYSFGNHANPTITYSVVQGGFAGTANVNTDPLFVDASNANYRLQPNSPALNTGNNAINSTNTDLAGHSRKYGIIDPGAYEFQCDPTQISGQPQNVSVCEAGTATFTVAAAGPNLIYKWYKDGQSAISNSSSSTLTINNVQSSDAGTYSVDVVSSCGAVTSATATLSIRPLPSITTQPANASACAAPNSYAPFSIAVAGTPTPTIQWQFSLDDGATWYNTGNNSTSVSIPVILPVSGVEKVRALVSNTCGTTTSNVATLTVNTKPVLHLVDFSTPGEAGGCSTTINVFSPTTDLSASVTYTIGTTPITFPHTFLYGRTVVTVTATNSCGTTTQDMAITVTDSIPPTFTAPAARNVSLGAACSLVVPDLITGLSGSDNCGAVTFSQSPAAGTVVASGHNQTQTVVITANDGHGNTTDHEVLLMAKDVTKPVPVLASLPAITGVGSVTITSKPTATDNCAGTLTATTTDPLTYTIPGTYSITWTYNDGNGNFATQVQTVVVTPIPHNFIVTNTADAGPGSLRQAIADANATANTNASTPDTVSFTIAGTGPQVISPLSALPTLTEALFIDGWSQPGWTSTPVIEINGSAVTSNFGLNIQAGNCVIRGLAINRFPGPGNAAGIGVFGNYSGNWIYGCHLGIDASGLLPRPNGQFGIWIGPGQTNVRIGTNADGVNDALERNVLSANSFGHGILMQGSNSTIAGNYIGVGADGTTTLGNTSAGIYIQNSSGNTVGGLVTAARNVISANATGIVIDNSSANTIQGNYIGTKADGLTALGNSGNGILITGTSTNNVIGGPAAGAGNTVAFNTKGIAIASGTGNNIQRNAVFSNPYAGIDLGNNGSTANDDGDPDTGANNLQNYPAFGTAQVEGNGAVTVKYFVPSSVANSAYPLRIDFYTGGFQQGKTYIGTQTYTAAVAGLQVSQTFLPAVAVNAGDVIVATATDAGGNTSEFSTPIAVTNALTTYYPRTTATDLSQVSNWTTDVAGGTGSAPANFSSPNQIFNVNGNVAKPSVLGAWTLSGGSNLVLNNTDSLIFRPLASLTVGAGSAADFNSKSVTLKSTAAGTAFIGQISGTLTGAINVTVERYISSLNNRAYRLLAPSVHTSASIRANWQENGSNAANYGTQITGSTTGANGFDASQTGQGSLFTYNPATPAWEYIGSTTANNLNAIKGYLIYLRGDRTVDLNSNASPLPSTSTTLRATGYLVIGTQTFPGTSGYTGPNTGFNLITNPYASAINWTSVYGTNTGLTQFYTLFDPNVGSQGGYVTVNTLGIKSNAGSNATVNIQSGQAFFVQATTATAPTVTIQESHKSTANNIDVFRTGNQTELFTSSLFYTNAQGVRVNADGVTSVYNNQYDTAVDGNDAEQIANFDEDVAIRRSGHDLSIESRPLIDLRDTIPFAVARLQTRTYEWEFNASNFNAPTIKAYLLDRFLNTQTPVSLSGTTVVSFTVTSNPASSAANRFAVVFAQGVNTPLPISGLTVKALQKTGGVQVEWTVQAETNTDRYEVEKSGDASRFGKVTGVMATNATAVHSYQWLDVKANSGANYYRIKAMGNGGEVQYSKVVRVDMGKAESGITVYPNPFSGSEVTLSMNLPKGAYTLTLANALGQQVYRQQMVHSGGAATQTLHLDAHLSQGVYQLSVSEGKTIFNSTRQ